MKHGSISFIVEYLSGTGDMEAGANDTGRTTASTPYSPTHAFKNTSRIPSKN